MLDIKITRNMYVDVPDRVVANIYSNFSGAIIIPYNKFDENILQFHIKYMDRY